MPLVILSDTNTVEMTHNKYVWSWSNFEYVYFVSNMFCSNEFSDTMTGQVILAVFTVTNILVPHF